MRPGEAPVGSKGRSCARAQHARERRSRPTGAALALTLPGTGSSGGVPRVGGAWSDCDPAEPRNRAGRDLRAGRAAVLRADRRRARRHPRSWVPDRPDRPPSGCRARDRPDESRAARGPRRACRRRAPATAAPLAHASRRDARVRASRRSDRASPDCFHDAPGRGVRPRPVAFGDAAHGARSDPAAFGLDRESGAQRRTRRGARRAPGAGASAAGRGERPGVSRSARRVSQDRVDGLSVLDAGNAAARSPPGRSRRRRPGGPVPPSVAPIACVPAPGVALSSVEATAIEPGSTRLAQSMLKSTAVTSGPTVPAQTS